LPALSGDPVISYVRKRRYSAENSKSDRGRKM